MDSIIKRENSMWRKEMTLREDQEKDRVFFIKDSIPKDKDSIPWAQDSILSIESDKIQIGAGKEIIEGIFPQGSILTW